MKTRKLFGVGFICLIVVMGVATYLWYLYFHTYEGEVLTKNIRLELINNGKTNYINAIPNDDESVIPIYYFRIKNNVNVPVKYNVIFNDVSATSVGDGCSDATNFKRNELRYELKLDNKIVKTGLLSEVVNDILYTSQMDGRMQDDYSLRVWLDGNTQNSLDRHYHYVVNVMEIEWKPF